MTAAGIKAASAQGPPEDPNQRTDYVPEDHVPKDHILRDPWSGELMRDEEGNLVVDWTGTPQWETYRKNARAVGGSRYGKIEVDSRLYGIRSRFVNTYRRAFDGGSGFGYSGTPTAPNSTKTYFFSLLSPIDAQMGIITPAGSTSPMSTANGAPFPEVIFNTIAVEMPMFRPGTLKADEVYALTAFVLFKNGLIKEDEVMNSETLAQVKMPNRNAFPASDEVYSTDQKKRGCYETHGVCLAD